MLRYETDSFSAEHSVTFDDDNAYFRTLRDDYSAGLSALAFLVAGFRADINQLVNLIADRQHHIDVAIQMIGFEERQAIRLTFGRPQMGKANPGRKLFCHRGQIVFRAHAERTGAEADAVGF